MYSGLPVMKMSHAVTDIAFNCRSEFMTKVVTFGRTMMRLTDTVKAVTHLAAGQLCLYLWQVKHTDVNPDMHNPWPYRHAQSQWFYTDMIVCDVMMSQLYNLINVGMKGQGGAAGVFTYKYKYTYNYL